MQCAHGGTNESTALPAACTCVDVDYYAYHMVCWVPDLAALKGAKGTISLARAKDVVPGPNCMLKSLWG